MTQPTILDASAFGRVLGPDEPLAVLYERLEQASANEAGTLYLRRLYAQVERWQGAFLGAAAALG
ncbi:hypothetical protein DFAR_3840006 [Desulfarculales bacterium]